MNLINLKLNFFTKLNHLKIIFLILHTKIHETRNIQSRYYQTTIRFRKTSCKKDKVTDSLINQFSQQNYLFQKRNTDNQLETNSESVKSKDIEKIKATENNNKTKDTGEEKSKKKPTEATTITIKTVNKILHMKLNLLIHETAKKIQKTMALKENKILLCKTKRYLLRKLLLNIPYWSQ